MTKNLDDRTGELEMLMYLVVDLARSAAAAGDMNNDVVEMVVELERRLELALNVTGYHE